MVECELYETSLLAVVALILVTFTMKNFMLIIFTTVISISNVSVVRGALAVKMP